MRTLLCSLILALMAAPAAALPNDEARHLLGRVGFAATPTDMAKLADLDRKTAVRTLIRSASNRARQAPPKWINDWARRPGKRGKEQRKAFRRQLRTRGKALRTWWLTEMLTTPTPLTEVMTLFWHNHFTSGLKKVKRPTLMYRQNVLLRTHALGDFRALLRDILRDPAMLQYLEGVSNTRRAPNENLARELLELFTLGEGHYTEADIKQVARALTGLPIDRRTGKFEFRQRRHDPRRKTILGQSGEYGADDVVRILMARPEVGRRIATKLWLAFVHESPEPAAIARLGTQFQRDPHIGRLLEAVLLTDAFWDPTTRGRLVKSPVDLVVGTARTFRLPASWAPNLLRLADLLGQKLMQPPNVKGWPGGTAWITTQSLVDRQDALRRFGEQGMADQQSPIQKWVRALKAPWDKSAQVAELLLPVAPADVEVLDRYPSAALVRQLLQDPVYQLK
jgi:uncharacterized protein (DUF1800 family)